MKFVDIFSGCGGLSHGFEQAGFKCQLAIDYNQDALLTHELNHDATTLCGDIREISDATILDKTDGKIDIVIGGPPCQGFSTVGKGDPDDERNHLFLEFMRVVKLLDPHTVVIENVTGLLAEKNKKTLTPIELELRALNYEVQMQVLKAELFEVPQKRRRLFIVASKSKFEFPKPIGQIKTLLDAFITISKEDSHQNGPQPNELDGKRLKFIPQGRGIRYEKDEELLPLNLRYEVDWKNLSEGRFRQTRLQRLDYDKPAPTIMTTPQYYHPIQDRLLNPRECAAIQSFVNFKFHGSNTAVYKQVGNAVPPRLAYHVALAVKESYDSYLRGQKISR